MKKSIDQAFQEFHKNNPHIYKYFKYFFFYLHDRKGWRKISGKLIIERCRWETITKSSSKDFKINNNFTAHYVRLFIEEYPQLKDCFELRTIHTDLQTTLF